MLIHSGLLDEYLRILKEQRWISGKAFKRLTSTSELKIKPGPFKVGLVTCSADAILKVIHYATGNEQDSGNDIAGLLGVIFTVLSMLIAHFCLEMVRNRETVDKFFMGLAAFEERYCKNGTGINLEDKRKLKSAKRTCKIMRQVGVKTTPFALSLVSIAMPKLAFNVLSFPPFPFIVETAETALVNAQISKFVAKVIVKAIAFFINLWFWILSYGIGIIMTNQIIIGTNCISVAVSIFNSRLRQLINGAADAKISITLSEKACLLYREIQLLSCYFNQIHSNVIISLLATAVIGQVINMVGLLSVAQSISSGTGDPENVATTYFQLMCHFEGVILCIICINFIFGFCGNVFDNSNSCLTSLNHQENLLRHKLLRRMVKSLPGIKIRLGQTNHIEKITPVVYQQFTTEKIVDTMLLRES